MSEIVPVESVALVSSAVASIPAVIASPADEIAAIDALNVLNRTRKALDSARSELVAPLNAQVKAVNAAYKPLLEKLEAGEANCKRAIAIWRDAERKRIAEEQDRIARENERKAREAEAAARAEADRIAAETRAAAEAAGMTATDAAELAALEAADVRTPVVVPQAAPPTPTATARGSLGAATSRMVWTFAVEDAREVPAEYLLVDESAVRAAIRAGKREIPGLRIYQIEQIAVGR